jgi:hypothetical protein
MLHCRRWCGALHPQKICTPKESIFPENRMHSKVLEKTMEKEGDETTRSTLSQRGHDVGGPNK